MPMPEKTTMKVGLKPAEARQASLWILRGKDVQPGMQWLAEQDQNVTDKLEAAIAEDPKGKPIAIIRTKRGATPPQIQVPKAKAFASYGPGTPNLFLPADMKMSPGRIRQDVLKKIFIENPAHVVWASPDEEEARIERSIPQQDWNAARQNVNFNTESLHQEHFKPLGELIDYQTGKQKQNEAWNPQGSPFEFMPMSVEHESVNQPLPSRDAPPPAPPKSGRGGRAPKAPATPKPPRGRRPAAPASQIDNRILASSNAEALKAKKDIESKLAAFGNPEAAAQSGLWPQFALANQAAGFPDQASLGWQNALWHQPENPQLLQGWAQQAGVEKNPIGVIEQLSHVDNPTLHQANQMAAALTWASRTGNPELNRVLKPAQSWVERNENLMGSKAFWLMSHALHGRTNDLRGTAERRDRLLGRLRENGLTTIKDAPEFIRNLGGQQHTASHYLDSVHQAVNDFMRKQAELLRQSPDTSSRNKAPGVENTIPYANLIGAVGMAKAGNQTRAEEIRRQALVMPQSRVGAGAKSAGFDAWARAALNHRVAQALENNRIDQPLPAELSHFGQSKMDSDIMKRYLRTLAPHGLSLSVDNAGDLGKEISRIEQLPANQIEEELNRLPGRSQFRNASASHLAHAIPNLVNLTSHLSRNASQTINRHLVERLLSIRPENVTAERSGNDTVNSNAWSAAATSLIPELINHNMGNHASELINRFSDIVSRPDKSKDHVTDVIDNSVKNIAHRMRKIGVAHQVEPMLDRMQSIVTGGRSLDELKNHFDALAPNQGSIREVDYPKILTALANIAGEHLALGSVGKAMPMLNHVHEWLVSPKRSNPSFNSREYSNLAGSYFHALGNLEDKGESARRISDVLHKSPMIVPSLTTGSDNLASVLHARMAEHAYQGILGHGTETTEAGRRWLGDDEHLVRRKVHADTDKILKSGGMA